MCQYTWVQVWHHGQTQKCHEKLTTCQQVKITVSSIGDNGQRGQKLDSRGVPLTMTELTITAYNTHTHTRALGQLVGLSTGT